MTVDASAYPELFRLLQPVSCIHFTRPGDPPSLSPRCSYDDRITNDMLRTTRELVKGRFIGGNIGYVFADDLEMYANTFCKPLDKMNDNQRLVLNIIRSCGPLTPRMLKEESGLLNKELMPVLHRLQKAFLVFEDQSDSDWERPWSLFEEEWPDLEIGPILREETTCRVIERFLHAHVFATLKELRDWSQLPARFLKAIMQQLLESERIRSVNIEDLGNGFMLPEDEQLEAPKLPPSVFMLHKADPLVKAHTTELKALFGKMETLQYLLIDGEFKGAVLGHWRIGPHDVDDVCLLLPENECADRKEEIISVIKKTYHAPNSQIVLYCGR